MFIVVMGISGSGKSSIGRLLAEDLDWPFYDGDDFHPPANIAKMSAGIPLTDEDRIGWLETLAALIREETRAGRNGVIACSALKKVYRDVLRHYDRRQVAFVYLKGSYETILARMQSRGEHFMKPEMLKSQLDTLEEPWGILTLNVTLPKNVIVHKIKEQIMEEKYALGILGLGVMGRSLAQNFYRNGYAPIGFDLKPKLPPDFDVRVVTSLEELTAALTPPRTLFLMVPAGAPVDSAIASLKPHLQAGDLIIDGGNSYFADTERRVKELNAEGLNFIGMGVSGGESGALWGPSMMPGGSPTSWPQVKEMFEAISAKAEDGEACVAWMGPGGAGHYVKMVHNGIEYGDMQLIAEIYDLLHRGAGIPNAELAEIFAAWNERELRSYLIEITANILQRMDEETGKSLVDVILDEAAQKGTGKWTSQTALDTGAAIPTINAAVESRLISALKAERVVAATVLGAAKPYTGNKNALVAAAEQALYVSKITSYAQGLSLLRMASQEYNWGLDIAQIVPVWRAGCIIRASLLSDITNAYRRNPALPNLLLDETFTQAVLSRESAWREVVQTAVGLGIPMLATSASLAYFDAYRSAVLPANLTQAQRDYFGAHTYRRVDREGVFHTQWE
ncbi:MAG: NADP-dependent phosphogluconate dehydrogenase [Anaerolineae bacterium]|nr:NADP-dependent phosphogluconate dehydrogenase [Anaerolineae bacterium]